MPADNDAFESFQRALREQVPRDSAWWRLRDSLFAAATYRAADAQDLKRHRLGLWSWSVWALRQSLRPAPSSQPARVGARFHFLFYGSHSAHFETLLPILVELSPAASCCAWTLGLTPRQEERFGELKNVMVVRAVSRLGILPLRERWRLIEKIFRNVRLITKLGGLIAETLRGAKSRVAQTFLDEAQWSQFWTARLGVGKGGAVFVTSESSVVAKSLVAAARERGARTIHFCHGLRHSSHQVTQATDLCVFSTVDKAWFERRVPNDCQVRAIGNPRLEKTRREVTAAPPRRAREPFHFLYFSQGHETPYTAEMKEEDLRILASPLCKQSCQIRIRPHPREPLDVLKRVLAKVGLEPAEFSRRSLQEDLSWAHAAGTSWSTALLEAVVCGRYCYWINARDDDFGGARELRAAGVGNLVRTPTEWEREIKYILDLETDEPAIVSDGTLVSLAILGPETLSWTQRLDL